MSKINKEVGERNLLQKLVGRHSKFEDFQDGVMEIYWVHSIVSYLCEEGVHDLEVKSQIL